jgi:phage tail-like protein
MGAGDYLNNGIFTVSIQDVEISFSKVTGIEETSEYDVYVEGGGQMHLLPKPSTSSGRITFEKGISLVDEKIAGFFYPGGEIHNVVIHIVKNNKNVENYYIENGIVESWELGELDAIHTGVAIKRFTIAHTGVRRL